MPQVFQVFRCFKCLVFQVHQTKKSNKFACKLCGEKQSIKRHYGIGTAKDCRLHVQQLNGLRGEIDQLNETKHTVNDDNDDTEVVKIEEKCNKNKPLTKSKWSDYVEQKETNKSTPKETMYLDNTEVVLEIPKKRRKINFKCPALKVSTDNTNCNTTTEEIPKVKSSMREYVKTIQRTNHFPVDENGKTVAKVDLIEPVPTIPMMSKKGVSKEVILPKTVNSHSKWVQFVEENDEFDENNEIDISSLNEKKPQQLFSLCNEDDLDDILDI